MLQSKPPKPVLILSWVWIVLGVIFALSGIVGLVLSLAYPLNSIFGLLTSPGKPIAIYLNQTLDSLWLFSLIDIIIGVIGIISGVHFLKLVPLARTVMEILTWLGLLNTVVTGVLFVVIWEPLINSMPLGFEYMNNNSFVIMGYIIGILALIIYCIPLGITIKYLRSKIVRDAIANRAIQVVN